MQCFLYRILSRCNDALCQYWIRKKTVIAILVYTDASYGVQADRKSHTGMYITSVKLVLYWVRAGRTLWFPRSSHLDSRLSDRTMTIQTRTRQGLSDRSVINDSTYSHYRCRDVLEAIMINGTLHINRRVIYECIVCLTHISGWLNKLKLSYVLS